MNKKCQIFTPELFCDKILDMADYRENLYGKKILENSCGDGNILTKIVKRYIEDCLKKGIEKDQIKDGLENDIYAFEIDKKHRKNCIIQLNNILKEYDISDVNWNIYKKDYLKFEGKISYDYIVGNPPYISYLELNDETRKFIRNKFSCCNTGKPDYCYAFIEKSYNELKKGAKFVYIIPNSILKNKYAFDIRKYIENDLVEVLDFKSEKVFPNAITSSVIFKIIKNYKKSELLYNVYLKENDTILKKDEYGLVWDFDNTKTNKELKFADYFNCSVSIATLLNKAFIIKNYVEDNDYVYFEKNKVEKKVLKNAISGRNKCFNKKEKIIFPYKYSKKDLCKFDEDKFEKKFPNAYKYLLKNKDLLLQRDSDSSSKWYEYGRSQALRHLNQPKILVSTIVTNTMKVYKLSKEDIPYSGIYITKKSNLGLDIAKKILDSEQFLEYVYKIGINASGNSLRINPSNISNFTFSKEEFELWKN